MPKLVLSLDFDGVLHSYTSGWKGADVIPDPPVEGAIEFVRLALEHFRVCICSSRCVDEDSRPFDACCRVVDSRINERGVRAMLDWLRLHGLTGDEIRNLEFWAAKPPSFLMIDDRALRFMGNWKHSCFLPERLKEMHPWNHKERHRHG